MYVYVNVWYQLSESWFRLLWGFVNMTWESTSSSSTSTRVVKSRLCQRESGPAMVAKGGQITVCGAHPHVRQAAVCVGFVSHRQLFQFIFIFMFIYIYRYRYTSLLCIFCSPHPPTVITFFSPTVVNYIANVIYDFNMHIFTRSLFQPIFLLYYYFYSHVCKLLL